MLTLPSKHILFFCWLSGNNAANISIIDRESVLLMQDFVIQCVWRMSPICRVLAFCGSFFFFFSFLNRGFLELLVVLGRKSSQLVILRELGVFSSVCVFVRVR